MQQEPCMRGETFLQDEAATVVERGFELRSWSSCVLCCTAVRWERCGFVAVQGQENQGSGWLVHPQVQKEKHPKRCWVLGKLLSTPKYCSHLKASLFCSQIWMIGSGTETEVFSKYHMAEVSRCLIECNRVENHLSLLQQRKKVCCVVIFLAFWLVGASGLLKHSKRVHLSPGCYVSYRRGQEIKKTKDRPGSLSVVTQVLISKSVL